MDWVMGCDIHLRVQAQAADGSWADVPEEQLGPDWGYNADYSNHPPRSRNYTLFGRLAGVRRDDWEPLFAERGVPEDLRGRKWSEREMPELSPEHQDYDADYAAQVLEQQQAHPEWDDWEHNPDYHSHTWATLAELRREENWSVELDWSVRTDPVVYRRWRDEGVMPGWDEHIPGEWQPGDFTVTSFAAGEQAIDTEARAEFARRMMGGKAIVQYTVMTKPLVDTGFVRWLSSPAAEALAQAAGGPERVRMLIAFDN